MNWTAQLLLCTYIGPVILTAPGRGILGQLESSLVDRKPNTAFIFFVAYECRASAVLPIQTRKIFYRYD